MLIKLIKRVREEMRKEAEVTKAMRRLAKEPLDYELLKTMINATADSTIGVKLTIKRNDGATITFEPANKNGIGYKSFKEKYEETHN